ncbi:fimbrillin family protein [uncultured Duncaniella sp.]|uniref:fimbrillin family protein n=1 Tax=uncultured Duncaniella sp. TaxID=2768039 RepID=UPI0025DC5E36|nr:fimbrillin family protein [uncultured Duncaniella sp.]
MKSNIMFGLAAAALTLTACSQEEILNNVESNPDVIGFSAVSNLTSRSADSYCNTNLPGAFNVVAITADGTEKFTDVAKGDGKGYTTEAAHYWGAEALNFHAYVNGTYSRDANGAYFKGFEPAANATEQLDLLYSVKNDVYRETVKLNFRHALSQIVFRAWNKSSLNVTISGVTIGHINSKGDFTFPTVNTEDNYENHELMADPTKQLEGQGTWDNVADSEFKNYTAKLNESITFTPNSEVGMITNVNHKQGGDLSMLLLPQQTKAWDPSQTGAAFNGAYFLLDVEFTNAHELQGHHAGRYSRRHSLEAGRALHLHFHLRRWWQRWLHSRSRKSRTRPRWQDLLRG